jgi:hypothetical protein
MGWKRDINFEETCDQSKLFRFQIASMLMRTGLQFCTHVTLASIAYQKQDINYLQTIFPAAYRILSQRSELLTLNNSRFPKLLRKIALEPQLLP